MSEKTSRISPAYTVVAHSPDVVELRTGIWSPTSFTLTDDARKGQLYSIVSGLDGSLSRRDLAKQIGVSRGDVEAVVDHLHSLGLIETEPRSALDAYVDHLGVPPTPGAAGVERVLLSGDPEFVDRLLERTSALTELGASVQAVDARLADRLDQLDAAVWHDGFDAETVVADFEPWRGALLVHAAATVNPLRMRALNRIALSLGSPVLHGVIDGPFVFVGPTVVPHRSACLECFETRVMANLRESASYLRYKAALAAGSVSPGYSPVYGPVAGLLVDHLALEATNFLATGYSFTIQKVLGMYLPTMEIAYNEVLPVPGCPACAPRAGRDDSTLYFDARVWLGND